MSEIRLLIDAIVDVQLTIHRPFVMKKKKKRNQTMKIQNNVFSVCMCILKQQNENFIVCHTCVSLKPSTCHRIVAVVVIVFEEQNQK